MHDKFSVLMSLYIKENPEHFRLALDSVICQTVLPGEIVVVEDGPLTEELYAVLDDYEQYIVRVKNEKNVGLGLALKKGLLVCKNELIARMDTDDIAYPTRFEKQLRLFQENPDLDICGGMITEFIDDENNIIGKRVVPEKDQDIKEYMKKRCPFNHMTVMYKKSSVLKAGNYVDFPWNEDYFLWIKMMENDCIMYNIPEAIVNVRVGKDMYARRGGMKYFRSEKDIQTYMLSAHIIGGVRYVYNVMLRFILQVVMTNKTRTLIYKWFARKK